MKILHSLTGLNLVRLLQNGGVGVLPTDTVYGVVARVTDRRAVARLYRLKQRVNKPGTVIAADVAQLEVLGLPAAALKHVKHLWPASISVVLPAPRHLTYLDAGKQSLAVRIPASGILRALLQRTGPLLTSSANLPGEPTAETVTEAQAYFADRVDFYVDNPRSIMTGEASTIVRPNPDGTLTVLRQGTVIVTQEQEIADNLVKI